MTTLGRTISPRGTLTLGVCLLALSVTSAAVAAAQPAGAGLDRPVLLDSASNNVAHRPSAVTRVIQPFLHNDLFALRRRGAATDFDYTSGAGITVQWATAPAIVRAVGRDRPGCSAALVEAAPEHGCVRATLGLAQAIYTPASNSAVPIRGQRPHAGSLAISGGAEWVWPHRRVALELVVGTSGPPALAEPVQGLLHALTGTDRELGWDNQLASRLLLGVGLQDRWQTDRTMRGATLRMELSWGGELGTRRVAANGGAELRLSLNRERVWIPSDGGTPLPLGPYLLGGVRPELVAYDLFLDDYGANRRSTAERRASVWQTAVGVGWRFARGQAEYRHVRRGVEYSAQVAPHAYGALVVSLFR